MSHINKVIDDDLYLVIDPETRTITNQSGNRITLMQYDHNSERLTFELPRYIDGHDMSESDAIFVNYTNISSGTSVSNRIINPGTYEITDLHSNPEDDTTLLCSWLISENATLLAGTVRFQIVFICNSTSKLASERYRWRTNVFDNIEVKASLDYASVIPELYVDVLEQWRNVITLTHEWNGTVLTITSPNKTSSVDLQGPIGPKGEKGDQGNPGITIPMDGNFISLGVDEDGNLYAYASEVETAPTFEYDNNTGNLYIIQEV